MRKRVIYLMVFFSFALFSAIAQESEQDLAKPTATAKGWFVGAQGGMPFGVSTFSSFGADKTRIGWSAGLYGGYRFNPVLSLEATAKVGQINLSAKQCCIDHNLWLGADGIRYNAPVLDMNGWGYDNLKSKVFTQHYGLQLNVNILGFFDKTKHGRWTLEVSPLLAAVGTKATLKTIDSNAEVSKGDTRWHLGAGGNLQAGFQATKHLNIGLYSGVTYLTCKRMDGVPEYRHKANYVWESGIKVGVKFGKKTKKVAPVVVPAEVLTPADTIVEETPQPAPEVTVCPEEVVPDTIIMPEPQPVVEEEPVQFPTIYFAFNSTRIRYSELPKVQQIRDWMRENPEATITITGWADSRGSKQVNDNFSRWRAEAVKNCLVSYGIAAERITVKGNGSDFNEADAAKARRVESVTIKCEEK